MKTYIFTDFTQGSDASPNLEIYRLKDDRAALLKLKDGYEDRAARNVFIQSEKDPTELDYLAEINADGDFYTNNGDETQQLWDEIVGNTPKEKEVEVVNDDEVESEQEDSEDEDADAVEIASAVSSIASLVGGAAEDDHPDTVIMAPSPAPLRPKPAKAAAPVSSVALAQKLDELRGDDANLDDLRVYLENGGDTTPGLLVQWAHRFLLGNREQMLLDMREMSLLQVFSNAPLNKDQAEAKSEILKTFNGRLGFPYFK